MPELTFRSSRETGATPVELAPDKIQSNGAKGVVTAAAKARQPKPRNVPLKKAAFRVNGDDLQRINTRAGLIQLLRRNRIKLKEVTETLAYEKDLQRLQVELVKLQRWVQSRGKRVAGNGCR